MASEAEIGHSRHRRELRDELASIVRRAIDESGWNIREESARLVAYDGMILGHTIRDQALQSRWDFGDRWIQIDIASTGDDWDALVLITSSELDLDAQIPQGSDSHAARDVLNDVLSSIS